MRLTDGGIVMRKHFFITAALAGAFLCSQPMLAQGSHEVRQAQQALKDKGFDPGPIDGIDGPRTRAALKDYQSHENLGTTGALDSSTVASLGLDKNGNGGGSIHAAGQNIKNSYSEGGHVVAQDSKTAGSDYKHGNVVHGTTALGKGVGEGTKDVAVGTAHAVVNTAKAADNAFVFHGQKEKPSKPQK